MEENLKEVLLKQVGNKLHDRVLIVENLPRKFLFEQTRKMIQRVDQQGFPDGTMAVDPSGELVWTLRPGIEKSQSGDGGFIFDTMERESKDRIADIMRYIETMSPRDQRLPEFAQNAQQIGDARSAPLFYQQMPRAILPAPAAPLVPILTSPALTTFTSGSGSASVTINPTTTEAISPAAAPAHPPENRTQAPAGSIKKPGMSPEHRAAAAARMRKLHEDRKKARAVAA